MQIGGIEPVRVLKLDLQAVGRDTSDLANSFRNLLSPRKHSEPSAEGHREYHPLIDSFITVQEHPAAKLTNEVKRIGYVIDTDQQPCLQLRPGDRIIVYLQ